MPDKKLPSQFLRSLDAYSVYDAPELAMDYAKEVGLVPCWPVHSAKRAQIDIMGHSGRRGQWMDTSNPLAQVCYGFEVAESIVKSLGQTADGDADGLEERFQAAVCCLEEVGK